MTLKKSKKHAEWVKGTIRAQRPEFMILVNAPGVKINNYIIRIGIVHNFDRDGDQRCQTRSNLTQI